ESESKV
nr:Chain F, G protein-activated inward rectifier potassium channel 3 [Rattus norvegicus]3QGL_G Chain G, G protein-activated inward rectifier potassium channel 3 [Rattus norvegicus]3QGL_H Chain H, G protein-activated inward rectifier potassium channel 3 [Rattus norvegicus]3QGL_I Chain I, G protein-activated inward rectifier potassium channel 3 [Rattus norvegicus]3QGL_J Chain J, G protein-activated inward rectifier potassium channel 3 [Rattus norvegicus]